MTNDKPTKTFLTMPYSGTVNVDCFLAATHHASADLYSYTFFPFPSPAGSHCENFNRAWATALNSRGKDGWTHFAMIHSDVEPEPNFLDTLVEEMARVDADVLSVVLPIKDKRGVTSTSMMDTVSMWNQRLTMKELRGLPETFTGKDIAILRCGELGYKEQYGHPATQGFNRYELLVSSGLWIAKMTPHPVAGAWQEQVWFEMRDRVARLPDGRFVAINFSEDWGFSRQCHEWGLRLFSTKKVRAWHHGGNDYTNDPSKWVAPSAWETDEDASCGEWLGRMEGMKSKVDGGAVAKPERCEEVFTA